jgi:hypothetical protein
MNSRYYCPGCKQKEKTFVRYIDKKTGLPIDSSVGRCNRESNCGYHYTPKQYFQEHNISFEMQTVNSPNLQTKLISKPKSASFIPAEVLKASLKGYETNHFTKFLIDLFGIDVTSELIGKYFIGTSKYWSGASVFWQIDITGRIRAGKIMLYSPETGKRVKEPFNHINWVHKVLKRPEFELNQCFFGEHLLKGNTKPVAIVESEKTAIIASIYLPKFIWLATGSSSNLTEEKFKILQGQNVVLYPDLNCYDKWTNKAKELAHISQISVSSLLETHASEEERKKGLDIADYLIDFGGRKPESLPIKTSYSESELKQIAFETIGINNHLNREKIPMIEQMMQFRIIKQAAPLPDNYYLAESYPF